MIKKTIKYADMDGIEHVEDFYFNLTKAEILELQVSREGGFFESMEVLAKTSDGKRALSVIKEIILKAYGERSDVGRHFIKRPEYAEAFSHTEAYSSLFMELFTDPKKAAEFFEGLMPADLMAEARAERARLETLDQPVSPSIAASVRHPQDHLPKQEPSVKVVRDLEIVQDVQTPGTISRADFMSLSGPEAQAFIAAGGKIEPEL